jgi:hypothetical protein
MNTDYRTQDESTVSTTLVKTGDVIDRLIVSVSNFLNAFVSIQGAEGDIAVDMQAPFQRNGPHVFELHERLVPQTEYTVETGPDCSIIVVGRLQ